MCIGLFYSHTQLETKNTRHLIGIDLDLFHVFRFNTSYEHRCDAATPCRYWL